MQQVKEYIATLCTSLWSHLACIRTITLPDEAMLFQALFLTFATGITAKPSIFGLISNESSTPLAQYPTQLTQNIVPKPIHSHNDCQLLTQNSVQGKLKPISADWRDVPLLEAIGYGVASVEADVWLINGTLFVCGDMFPSFELNPMGVLDR